MKISFTNKISTVDAIFVCKAFCGNKAKKIMGEELNSLVKTHSDEEINKNRSLRIDLPKNKCDFVILGKKIEQENSEKIRNLAAEVLSVSNKNNYKKIIFVAADIENIEKLVEGFVLGSYSFDKYLSKKKTHIDEVILVLEEKTKKEKIDLLNKTIKICEEVNYVRDIVNEPANVINPQNLMKEAQLIGKEKRVRVKIFNTKNLEKLKMGALLAVGQGSVNSPQMASIEYFGSDKKTPKILLVGKGITFDSGGMHLKPSAGINNMKYDMAGAATVLGVMRIVAKLQPKINIVALVPTAENMVDSSAVKPNDIIKSYSGKTIEITNTDAEGRLILADALAYGIKNFKPDFVIDIATLTGACIVALGNEISGVVGNDQGLIDKLLAAGKKVDEKVWQLPLDEKLRETVKGDISDLKNHTPEVAAGTIMGGAFLSYFTEGSKWAHIDMGGSAWNKANEGYWKKGGSGRNVRLVYELINNL